jgi:hypothetical protein
MKRHHPTVHRVIATELTKTRYLGRTFKFATVDCGKMVGFQLRKLGHKLELPKIGAYSTPAGALAWLRERGFESLEARLDALGLRRIAAAEALVGDVVALESVDALAALCIYLGDGRYLGFHEDSDVAVMMKPTSFSAAWRTL